MKKAILLLLTFSLSFIINVQTVDEYVEYIQEQGKDPKEYIFEKFKEVDVIILGERSYRDTTQYDLIMDILKDPRFAEDIGYVYTEVGVTNMTEAANRLIKGEYADDEAFYSSFIKFFVIQIMRHYGKNIVLTNSSKDSTRLTEPYPVIKKSRGD